MPFRRLSWKLTLSYTLVTAGAVLVLGLIGLGALGVYISRPSSLESLMADIAADLALEMTPYLVASPPNTTALEAQLQESLLLFQSELDTVGSPRPDPADDWGVIIGPGGEILAVSRMETPFEAFFDNFAIYQP